MPENNITFFLFASSIAILLISIGLLFFVAFFFRSKKNTQLKEQANKMRYEQALASTKTEVRSNTLSYISKELHDNVGQLLAIAKRYSGNLKNDFGNEKLTELDNILLQTASEVRHISKSLSEQGKTDFSLIDALQQDIARIEKLGLIQFATSIQEYDTPLTSDQEVILFRIMQEFISNTLKHSEATQIRLSLKSTDEWVQLALFDNGIGYTPAPGNSGSGLKNMQARADMLAAKLLLQSEINNGTSLHLSIPTQQ